jgi:predicted Fe-Mo cluster-binding NifX family protein
VYNFKDKNRFDKEFAGWTTLCKYSVMKQKTDGGKIAITVWEQRISPVFDSGRTLLIAEIKNHMVASSSYLTFDFDRPLELVRMLRAAQVKVIICGAISEGPANMLVAAGFTLISFITGDVRRVLATLVKGAPLGEDFKMPGCGKNVCCRGKIRRGREISMAIDNGGGAKGRRPSPPVAAPKGDDMDGGATSAEMPGRLPGQSVTVPR